jgi:hypothetical protein
MDRREYYFLVLILAENTKLFDSEVSFWVMFMPPILTHVALCIKQISGLRLEYSSDMFLEISTRELLEPILTGQLMSL